MSSITPIPCPIAADGSFAVGVRVETADNSTVFSRMWLRWGPLWADYADVAVGEQGGAGLGKPVRLANNGESSIEVARGVRCITLEGSVVGRDPRKQMSVYLLALDK